MRSLPILAISLLAVLLVLGVAQVDATTFYWDPATGLDANLGTAGAPWKTLFKVRASVGPGDLVLVRGGTFTPAQYKGESGVPSWTQSASHGKGAPGNPITIRNFPGEIPLFEGERTQYWMRFGPSSGTAHVNYYIIIDGLRFQHFDTTAIGVFGLLENTGHARYVTVQNCRFDNFYDGGSANLVVGRADFVIFRNNHAFNMGDQTFSFDGGGDHGTYPTEWSSNVVLDSNYFEKVSGYGMHLSFDVSGTRGWMNQYIVRRNTVVNSFGSGIAVFGCDCLNTYIYNNTIYNEANPFPQRAGNTGSAITNRIQVPLWNHFRIFNNIGYGRTTNGQVHMIRTGTDWTDVQLDYNLWLTTGTTTQFTWGTGTATTAYTTLAAYQAATGQEAHSQLANPVFTNATARDFTLQAGSPAINAGRPLTATTGSGTASTALVVADAGYFFDGYDMVEGDTIQIGTQAPVIVTAVNYGTKTLTLASPRTWTTGATVSLAYNGTAPDMGAFESGEVTPVPPPSTLVAHYHLDENTGTTTADATGRGHTGTLVGGATWSTGLVGAAVSLDGVNDGVTIPDHADFTFTAGFTVVASFYATSLPASQLKIVGQWDHANQNLAGWQLLLESDGHLSLKTRQGGTTAFCNATTPTFSLNTWYQVAATYSGGTVGSNCTLYVNGAAVFTGTLTQAPQDSPALVGIGTVANNLAGMNWPGSIDEVRLYQGALTATEIAALYLPDTLVLDYRFDEGTGTTTADASGHGHTGTLISGATWGPGLLNSGVVLNGASAGVTTPDSPDFTFSTGFSILASFYAVALPANEIKIIGQWDHANQDLAAWQLLLDGAGHLTLKTRAGVNTAICTDATTPFALNTWYQVAATYSGGTTGTNCRLYVNGVQTFAGTLNQIPQDSGVIVGVGTVANNLAGLNWPGAIDNVRLYKGVALSAAEILELFLPPPLQTIGNARPGATPFLLGGN